MTRWEEAKAKIRQALSRKKRRVKPKPPPRYDAVYWKYIEDMNKLENKEF